LAGLAVLAVLLFGISPAAAQPMKGWQGSGGWGAQGQYQRLYNPATVEIVTGEVTKIDKITPVKGMSYGIHLQLKTDKETVAVHLGPGWYIERLDTKIEVGDMIEVKGSRVTLKGGPAIIAAEVRKGDAVLNLRDDSGLPYWAGWRRR
jgi:DNA-directed RNA polymerase subunit E'/Rpb7